MGGAVLPQVIACLLISPAYLILHQFVSDSLPMQGIYLVDYQHVLGCVKSGGYKIGWIGDGGDTGNDDPVYLVRPRLPGFQGGESAKDINIIEPQY
jgi:hypothetical protein